MARRVIELWKCGDCGDEWNDESDARVCCAPTPEKCRACPECDETHDEEHDAESCCCADLLIRCPRCARDYASKHINALAIELAGHCNTCNPSFTHDQQFAIEHKLEQIAPWSDQRLR